MNTALSQARMIIHCIDDLPTLPTTLTKIINEVERPSATAHSLAEILQKDPSISSVILKIVNSAFYGSFRQINSISHAAVMLGFQMVKTIALGVSIIQAEPDSGKACLDRKAFWIHSFAVGTLTKRLALLTGNKALNPDSSFLCGLLHDVGKVIFDNYFSENYQETLHLANTEKRWVREVEDEQMGLDHAMAGYYLARKWQFPLEVVSAIRYHHAPGSAEQAYRSYAALVQVADHGCHSIGIGNGADQWVPDPEAEIFSLAGITPEQLAQELEIIKSQRGEFEVFVA